MYSRLRKTAFLVLSLASIGALLTHMPGWISMHFWGYALFPIVLILMGLLAWWGAREKDEEFLRCIYLGAIGGLLGTVGYDVFRIPFHHMGLNLLSPIRAYGMWLVGAETSTYWTDLIGFCYHLSNGITFGWVYAMVAHRRHMAWALVWGLTLETLAVFSSFGLVFGLRQYSNAVLLAFIAHLFYGWPLGVICEDKPEPTTASRSRSYWKRHRTLLTVMLTVAVGCWFILVRPAGWTSPEPSMVEVGPRQIQPTWSDLKTGTLMTVRNLTDSELTMGLRSPGPDGHEITQHSIPRGGEKKFDLPAAGIYQIQAMNLPDWRSVFIAVNEDGDYRSVFLNADDATE